MLHVYFAFSVGGNGNIVGGSLGMWEEDKYRRSGVK